MSRQRTIANCNASARRSILDDAFRDKRLHKRANPFGLPPEDLCPDEDAYGPRLVLTPEQKRRADAEWNEMDERGQLPAGWKP